ncbi:MAG: uridine phosphorylase [Oscillospiraceae bacterium]|nr:uridine phosphorylase [Oscillospiraceae bacterium]
MALLDPNFQYHLQISADKNQVGKYVILPGDPGRVSKIAEYLDDPKHIATNREYVTYTGSLDGTPVSVVSTGIGGPSAAIAIEELVKCGCHTFVRVGTSGGINLKVHGGDLVIASAAIRGDGASAEYLPSCYPAVADFEVVSALAEAAKQSSTTNAGNAYHVGVVQSKDSFYGEVAPETMPIAPHLHNRWNAYLKAGCLASEMEAATLFSVALVREVRAGAVLTALWNVERSKAGLPDSVCKDNSRAIKCAVEAVRKLIVSDRSKS